MLVQFWRVNICHIGFVKQKKREGNSECLHYSVQSVTDLHYLLTCQTAACQPDRCYLHVLRFDFDINRSGLNEWCLNCLFFVYRYEYDKFSKMDFINIAIIGKFLPDNQLKLIKNERLFVYNEMTYELFMDIDQIQFKRGNLISQY